MKIEQAHIDHIKTVFEKMQSREDLLHLLNEAKPMVYGDKAIPFELRQISWYANPKLGVKRYTEFKIKKKSGADRCIHSPVNGLKSIQKTLGFVLQCVYEPHNAAMGFVKDKSIVDNAKLHVGSKYVYNIDLKDFFPSIDQARVWKCFQLKPFNLFGEITNQPSFDSGWVSIKRVGRKDLANILASLCCTEIEVERKNENGKWEKVKRNVLPQGAPTSPVITNIVCRRLDYLLSATAKRFGLKYSRYADDITFSSMHNVYQPESEFLKELHRIIAEQNFHIKESKTRLQKDGYRKEVTGLLVNEKVNVQQRYIKQLRMWLYYWERYGYERASRFFLQQYIADKGHVKSGKPDMVNVIAGKLDYLKMVKGANNELYLKLNSRFKNLNASSFKPKTISETANTAEIDTNQVKITLEVYQSPKTNQKLFKSINIPKDTVLPNTIIVPNSIEEAEEDNKPNKLFPHNPIYTISFLKKFKIGDGSGFKELVHDVILSDETMQYILNEVKCHPNFISHYKGEKVVSVSFINRGIVMSVRELINLFETEGLPYYKNSHKHPFNNDSKYTNFAKKFKRKYRYGSGSEYSKLQDDIINIFNDQHVPVSSLSFLPDERKFNIRSSFFTWQPSVFNGLRYIIQGIADHSNINGVQPFSSDEKEILIEVERIKIENLNFVELRIFDCRSVSKNDSETLLHYLKGSFPYQNDLRNLCDWVVECDFFDEPSKRLNLLVAPEYSLNNIEIEELNIPVGGFKHILRFYDAR
jgi:RNA-directed DNA polymerase